MRITLALLAVLVFVGQLLTVSVGSRFRQTCIQCRLERVDYTLFGDAWQEFTGNEFSRWHDTHRPPHQHEWSRLTCSRGFSIFGTATYYGCGPRHKVCWNPPEVLKAFVDIADARTVDAYFKGITSTNEAEQMAAVDLVGKRLEEAK